MYPSLHASRHPDRAAFIMASTGETVSYGELERRTNRLAHFLRRQGLGRLDHYTIFMENNARYVECCGAGERAGLYYTPASSYLTPDELAYVLGNSRSRVLITSKAKLEVARRAPGAFSGGDSLRRGRWPRRRGARNQPGRRGSRSAHDAYRR